MSKDRVRDLVARAYGDGLKDGLRLGAELFVKASQMTDTGSRYADHLLRESEWNDTAPGLQDALESVVTAWEHPHIKAGGTHALAEDKMDAAIGKARAALTHSKEIR